MKGLSICLLLLTGMLSGSRPVEHRDLLTYQDKRGNVRPVKNQKEWNIKRRQILDSMQAVMGPLPERSNLPPLHIRYTDSSKENNYIRYTIEFTVAKKEDISAYLYVPIQQEPIQKRPAMLALHPTGVTGKEIVDGQSHLKNRGYAMELADKGYVVIAPDYPDFGGLKDYNFNTDRYVSGTMKSIFDEMRCIDLLCARKDVDSNKIGVIGHSLGGHSAIFVGAFDTRLKVVISSCGWTLFPYYFNGDSTAAKERGGRLWPWAQERYMPFLRTNYHLDPDRLPFDFDEVIAAIAPRAFFSNSPLHDANFNINGVKKGMDRIAKVYRFLHASQALQVRYPASTHDFPPLIRAQAYHFIDSLFHFNSRKEAKYSYLDNISYLKRLHEFSTENKKATIIMLGNSLTERCNWKKLLQREDVMNQGIGSDITRGFIQRIKYVFELHPKICFIEGGVNDLVHPEIPMKAIIHNLSLLIDTLRSRHIIPVLNTATLATGDYKYMKPEILNRKIIMLNNKIFRLAKRKKVKCIDLNPMTAKDSLRLPQYAVADGIHYTSQTYLLWKEEIEKIAKEYHLKEP